MAQWRFGACASLATRGLQDIVTRIHAELADCFDALRSSASAIWELYPRPCYNERTRVDASWQHMKPFASRSSLNWSSYLANGRSDLAEQAHAFASELTKIVSAVSLIATRFSPQ